MKVEQDADWVVKLKVIQRKMMGIAESLYERGWRARDRDLLKKSSEFSDEEIDIIVLYLKLLE